MAKGKTEIPWEKVALVRILGGSAYCVAVRIKRFDL